MSNNRRGDYAKKLLDPRWQKMRLQILERDKWCCRFCLSTKKTLHVHHLWYERNKEPWEYPPETLLTLCVDCHQNETDLRKDAEAALIRTLRARRWSVIDVRDFTAAVDSVDPMEVFHHLGDMVTWAISDPEALNDILIAYLYWRARGLTGSIAEGVKESREEWEYIQAEMEKQRQEGGEE